MTSRNRWMVLAVVSSALLLIVIDMTVLYTALPRLTADLGATASQKLWIVNAYALTMAGLLPAAGSLGDRFGPRRMFLSGLVVFGLASVLAAFAPTAPVLIFGRVILAIGAAMMMPATLSIIRHTFEDEDERSLAIGVWAAVAAGGAAFGPILGGLLLEFFWWGSVFLINLPIVALALLAGVIFVQPHRGAGGHPFSLLASVQIMVGLVATTLAIKELGKSEPSLMLIAVTAVIGVGFVAIFIRGQMRAAHPMLDLRVFANPAFSSAVVAALIASAALMGLSLAMTQRFQLVQGLSPLEAGIALLPMPLASFVAGPVAGRILPRVGSRRLLPWSMALIALGLGLYLLSPEMQVLQGAALALIGAGVGATMTTSSAAILQNAPEESTGTAASVEEVSYELGGALGVTIFGSILSAVYMHGFAPPAGLPDPDLARIGIDQAMAYANGLDPSLSDGLRVAAAIAFEGSFVAVLVVALVMLVIGGLGIALWNRGGREYS